MFDDLADLLVVGALHDQRRGAEHFCLQRRVGEKLTGLGDEQVGLALVRGFALQADGHCISVGMLGQRADAGLVGLENTGGEHGLRRAAL
ncbi:hypothetical protein D3C86_2079960 [compost metagenome]